MRDERPTGPPDPCIGIWGTFDVANFGDLLFPRIFEQEMKRRLPQATVRSFSPLGSLRSVQLDGGAVAEPLGEWTTQRIVELERELDFVAVGGGEIIHEHDAYYGGWYEIPTPEAERLRPSQFFIEGLGEEAERRATVAWHSVGIPFDLEGEFAERVRAACQRRPYISVRDEGSRARLVRAGVERDVSVVPDSALVLKRLFAHDVLERRLGYLKAIRAFPTEGNPLALQGSRALLPHVEAIGRALAPMLEEEDVPVLLLETGPCHGDGEFADAISPYLPPDRTYRLPESVVVEDLVAAISHSRGFVGISLHGSITALAFDVPFAILDLVGYAKLSAFAQLVGAEAVHVTSSDDIASSVARVLARERSAADIRPLVARIDDHFDRLAELAEMSAKSRHGTNAVAAATGVPLRDARSDSELRYASLRTAYEARGRALVRERGRMMSLIERHERSDGLHHLADQLERSHARLAAAQEEIRRLHADLARARTFGLATRTRSFVRSRVLRDDTPLGRVWGRMRGSSLP